MLLKDKVFLVTGILNKFSISTSIANQILEHGGKIIIQVQKGLGEKKIERITKDFDSENVLGVVECDASSPESIREMLSEVKKISNTIHGFAHSIGACNRERLVKSGILQITQTDLTEAINVSTFSYVAMVQGMLELELFDESGASCIALSYLGGEQVIPHYDLMGICKAGLETANRYLAAALGEQGVRCNILSPGPMNTAAGRGISDFNLIGDHVDKNCFLTARPNQNDAAKSAVFLLSDLSSGMTAEVVYCDGGYHNNGLSTK